MIVTDRKILHQVSKMTTVEEIEHLDIINKLREATKTAWTRGCGLAAIQIGIPIRCAWFHYKERDTILINPVLVYGQGLMTHPEGCLSIPDKWTEVPRFHEIEYLNNGKRRTAKGFRAVVIQHEIDHMNGILNDEKEKL
jgi:peptide deformylase